MNAVAEIVPTVQEANLPAGWTLATIEDLVGDGGVFVDGDWVESKDQDPEGDVRLIQLADIGDGEYRDKSARFLTHAKAVELGCTFLKKGDVLIARMPDPLGRACIFPGDSKPAVTVVDVAVVRSAAGEFDHRWLMYFANAPAFRSAVASMQSGSTRKRISRGNLAKIALPVPPLDQQKRIVAEIEKQFSRLDEAVANLKRVKANLKRYRAAVLKAAVEGRLVETEAQLARREGRSYETGEQLLQRILETRPSQSKGKRKYKEPAAPDTTDLPELPEGWVWCSGAQFFEWSSGEGLTEKNQRLGPYPVYGGNGISGHHDEYFVEEPTIVVGRVGAHCGNVYVTKPKSWITDNAIYAKSFPSDVPLEYLQIVFEQAGLNRIAAGSGQPFVNQRMLNEVPVPLPPLNEQLRILAEVERRLSILGETEAQVETNLKRADALRQAVLASCFSSSGTP